MSYVLGIDGGGSKTVCILMDDTGQVLGRGEAGASNYQSVGKKAAFFSLQSAIAWAIGNQKLIKVEAICLGLAGIARPGDIQVAHTFVEQLKSSASIPVIWALAPKNVVICHDALIALVGGVGQAVGIVAIAGTGTIIFGRNQQGYTKRVGGWGHILGDEASAYHIAVSGMRAAMRAYDGRDKATTLQERIREHLGLTSLENLVEVIYQQGWGVKEIAALAPLVDEAAASGDEVAMSIIEDAVKELVKATTSTSDVLFSSSEGFEVVTTGSVWRGLSKIRDKFEASLVRQKPEAKVIFPRYEPAYGASLLALNTLFT
jgi:N-acetylglucosamine kinase-like BadF-type ATPase